MRCKTREHSGGALGTIYREGRKVDPNSNLTTTRNRDLLTTGILSGLADFVFGARSAPVAPLPEKGVQYQPRGAYFSECGPCTEERWSLHTRRSSSRWTGERAGACTPLLYYRRDARPARTGPRNFHHLRSRHAVLRLLNPAAWPATALDRVAARPLRAWARARRPILSRS